MTGIFRQTVPLVLASASPRRQHFLRELGVEFRVLCPQNIEPLPLDAEDPATYAMRAARAKSLAAAKMVADENNVAQSLVIAADTVVDVDGVIFGKPRDTAHALAMLRQMSGRRHRVVSAVSLVLADGSEQNFYDSTDVFFHPWPESVLLAYALHEEGQDKAGAYAIQGHGSFLVSRIEGSWSTVVGLPVSQCVDVLFSCGALETLSGNCFK